MATGLIYFRKRIGARFVLHFEISVATKNTINIDWNFYYKIKKLLKGRLAFLIPFLSQAQVKIETTSTQRKEFFSLFTLKNLFLLFYCIIYLDLGNLPQ